MSEMKDTVIALGTFDGVHRGHAELIRRGLEWGRTHGAKLTVCAFDRHPLSVIRPESTPAILTTAEEQAARLKEIGADTICLIPFNREMADTEPEDFLKMLREKTRVRAIVAGWNYTFGRGGSGTAETLKADGEQHGYEVIVVPPVKTEAGEIISSSAIRKKLAEGDLDGANDMLGYAYRISGTVVNGKHEGTRIGYPTANIRAGEGKQMPEYGVYACRAMCGGNIWNAVVNIGLQPTLPSGDVTVEAHILDAEADFYGKQMEIRLEKFLRGERKFDSVEALTQQIGRDMKETEDYFLRG